MEFIALIGIGVTVISTGVALAALILNTQRNQREEIKTLREDTQAGFKAVREEIQAQREEMKTEFKAVREEIQAQRGETKTEFKAQREEMKTEFKTQREETKTEFKTQREETKTEFKTQRETIISLLERMAHLEGLLEGLREVITGRRVAEEAGKYDTR